MPLTCFGLPERGRVQVPGCRGGVAAALLALGFLAGCGGAPEEEFDLGPVGRGVTADFAATQPSACSPGDPPLLSLQKATVLGPVVNVDITLSDCDASLVVSGLNFELSFDDTVIDFLGCSAGTLFPAGQLVTGTPACAASGGNLIGTIALQPPNAVSVTGGQASVIRLTFSLIRRVAATGSPAAFIMPDSLPNTSLFFADPVTQVILQRALGGAGYAGGSFTSN